MSGPLSGRESCGDLYRMALDPEYWDLIGELASSPAAWPDFRRWADQAAQVGPELAGEPPEPPERARSIWPFRRTQHGRPASTAPAPDRDTEATQTFPAVPPAEICEERPRMAWRGHVRSLARPVAFTLATVMLAGIGYAGVTLAMRPVDGQTAQAGHDRRQVQKGQLARSRRDAEDLLKKVAASPVADDGALPGPMAEVRSALDDGRGPDQAARIGRACRRLDKVWGSLMDTRAEELARMLDGLVGRADGLAGAPDSEDHRSMTALADDWRGRRVGRDNLAEAAQAASDLDRLSTSVQADAERQAREAAETAAREADVPRPQSPTYVAPGPGTVAPQRVDGQNNAPPAGGGAGQGGGRPSWSVPAPSGPDTGLPDRDPGL